MNTAAQWGTIKEFETSFLKDRFEDVQLLMDMCTQQHVDELEMQCRLPVLTHCTPVMALSVDRHSFQILCTLKNPMHADCASFLA